MIYAQSTRVSPAIRCRRPAYSSPAPTHRPGTSRYRLLRPSSAAA